MEESNYIDIAELMKPRYIYRVIPVSRLFEIFENKQNVLVKPKKWDDPFENFILRSRIKLKNGKIAEFGFHDQFYGQCWTLHSASDAIWRIYSPKKDKSPKLSPAVRIRTTIEKLATSLSWALGDTAQIQAYIGKVSYLPEKRLIAYANSWFKGTGFLNSRVSAQTLLVKRPAFRHEREIRLLFFRHHDAHGDFYHYSTDPHKLIDQIMMDPRLSRQEAQNLKIRIQNKTGYKGKILHSLSYIPLRQI